MADEVESQAINEEGTGVKQSQKAEINLPLSLPKEQSGEKEEAPAKTTSTLDENSKQPKSMEDVYKESETRKIPPSPTRICRECLEEAYGLLANLYFIAKKIITDLNVCGRSLKKIVPVITKNIINSGKKQWKAWKQLITGTSLYPIHQRILVGSIREMNLTH